MNYKAKIKKFKKMGLLQTSEIRQDFDKNSEMELNQLIDTWLDTNFKLYSMAYYFERQDISLDGFSSFIKRKAKSGKILIRKMLDYMNTRGGKVIFNDIKRPSQDEWGTGSEAVQVCLELLKKLYETVNQVDQTATTNNDLHFRSFLEKEIMGTLLINIRLVGSVITDLQRTGSSAMGEYAVNKDLARRYGIFSVTHYNAIDEVLLHSYEDGQQDGGYSSEKCN